jgi:WD40 repeat protein
MKRLLLPSAIALILVACQVNTLPAMPDDVTASATTQMISTPIAAPSLSPTVTFPQPPATANPTAPVETPLPSIDFDVTYPYLQDGGAVPPNALARLGIGLIYGVVPSNDNQITIFTSTGIYAYSLPSFDRIWRHYYDIVPWDASISPDGQRIVTEYGWDGAPVLYAAETGERIATLDGWRNAYWSPDSQYVAIEEMPEIHDGPFDTHLLVYSAETGNLEATLTARIADFFGGVFSTVSWSPDSRQVAACGDEAVYIWNAGNAAPMHELRANSTSGGLYLRWCSMAYSNSGDYLAIRDTESLRVLDTSTAEELYLDSSGAERFFWYQDDLYVATSSGLSRLMSGSWELLPIVEEEINSVRFSPSRDRLVISTPDRIMVLDADTYEPQYSVDQSFDWIDWSPDGSWLIGGTDEEYFVMDSATGELLYDPFVLESGMVFVDDHLLFTVDNQRAALVDLSTGSVINRRQMGFNVDSLAWSEDSANLYITTTTGDRWAWNEIAGVVQPIDSEEIPVGTQLNLSNTSDYGPGLRRDNWLSSPDRRWTAVVTSIDNACGDGPYGGSCGPWGATLEIMDTGTQDVQTEYEITGTGIMTWAWAPGSDVLAIGEDGRTKSLENNEIVLLNARTGEEMIRYQGHLDSVIGLLFSPDGSRLASVSRDGTVIVWLFN